MGGLLRRMPWTGGALLVGCLAIAGVPPLNGFVSEWLTLQALIGVASGPGAGIAAAGGVAVAGLATTAALGGYCFVKVAGLVLLGTPRTPEAAAAADAPASTRAALAALAAACLALAAVPGLLLPVLAGVAGGAAPAPAGPGLTVPGSGGLPTPALLVTFAGLVVAVGAARGRRRAAAAPAWACGQPVTGLAWTSAGFTKPLRLVLEAVLRPQRAVTRAGRAGVLERVTYRAAVPHLFDTALYRPTARAALRGAAVARRLQSGSVRTYAAYLLAAFVSALVLAHWGLLG
jgi:hydrogenase-4 component B